MLDKNRDKVIYSDPIIPNPSTMKCKGKKKKEYGEKGENVFYASKNKWIIKWVEKKKKKHG